MPPEHKTYQFERKVKDLVVLSQSLSTTGKYEIFYGEHFRQGKQCYDVGYLNCTNGEIVRRHYQSKSEALAYWEEFYQSMTKPNEIPEEDEGESKVIIN